MKRGELSTSTIVIIIIILAGFALVIFFWYQISWTGEIDKQVCHQSVIYRATLPGTAGAKDFIPLKCKTDKICITSKSYPGSCKEFENAKGITIVKADNVQQIEKTIAENIIACWKTMGEGKASIFSQWIAENYGFGATYPSCIICNRIAFDSDGLKKAGINLDEMNVENYMRTRAIPDKDISYYDYLAGENGKISFGDKNIPDYKIDEETGKLARIDSDGNEFFIPLTRENAPSDYKELSVLFMQISAPSHGQSAMNIGELALGGLIGGFATAPVTTAKSLQGLGKLCTSGGWIGPVVCGGILAIAGVVQQGNVAYNRAVSAGYCGDVSAGGEERNGCSVVRTVNYNATAIKEYCAIIESIP